MLYSIIRPISPDQRNMKRILQTFPTPLRSTDTILEPHLVPHWPQPASNGDVLVRDIYVHAFLNPSIYRTIRNTSFLAPTLSPLIQLRVRIYLIPQPVPQSLPKEKSLNRLSYTTNNPDLRIYRFQTPTPTPTTKSNAHPFPIPHPHKPIVPASRLSSLL